jgi:hypothetical protein
MLVAVEAAVAAEVATGEPPAATAGHGGAS